jgi:hypothetical protein
MSIIIGIKIPILMITASRLEARGHAKTDLIPIFKEAFTALAEAPTSNFSNNTAVPDDTLFFHTEYHP